MGDNRDDQFGDLEPRKLKEIEHSRTRRSILQGFERRSDTSTEEQAEDLDVMIRDKEAFKYHYSNIKFYSITQSSEEYQHAWLRARCTPGCRVLDFACGNGENGIYAAQLGADVTGIDISPEGVANANQNAKGAGVAEHCVFKVMDGENMTFEDDAFALAVEYGALHHVELDKALSELSRVLKPSGSMICTEALKHNYFIHSYRKRTPHLRTEWEVEHILGVEDAKVMRRYFGTVDIKFFHLAVLAAVPFRRTSLFKPLRAVLEKIDDAILRSETIGKYAWIMVVTLSNPIK